METKEGASLSHQTLVPSFHVLQPSKKKAQTPAQKLTLITSQHPPTHTHLFGGLSHGRYSNMGFSIFSCL